MTMLVAVRERHFHSRRTKGSLAALTHTEDQAVTLMAVAGMRSGRVLWVGQRQAHVQWQQTCGADVRRRTIASGSCCCSPVAGSRSCSECRTESFAAIAHAMADRRGSRTVASARGRVS